MNILTISNNMKRYTQESTFATAFITFKLEAYLEPKQTSGMELFAKSQKAPSLNVRVGSQYTFLNTSVLWLK